MRSDNHCLAVPWKESLEAMPGRLMGESIANKSVTQLARESLIYVKVAVNVPGNVFFEDRKVQNALSTRG
jgi:hypothetical protein